MGNGFGDYFPFLVFSVYLVIFYVDLGPSTSVMGGFGVFWGFCGFNGARASFGGVEFEYPVDLRAVVVRTAGKFLGIFFLFV